MCAPGAGNRRRFERRCDRRAPTFHPIDRRIAARPPRMRAACPQRRRLRRGASQQGTRDSNRRTTGRGPNAIPRGRATVPRRTPSAPKSCRISSRSRRDEDPPPHPGRPDRTRAARAPFVPPRLRLEAPHADRAARWRERRPFAGRRMSRARPSRSNRRCTRRSRRARSRRAIHRRADSSWRALLQGRRVASSGQSFRRSFPSRPSGRARAVPKGVGARADRADKARRASVIHFRPRPRVMSYVAARARAKRRTT